LKEGNSRLDPEGSGLKYPLELGGGGAYLVKKVPGTATTPVATAFKICTVL